METIKKLICFGAGGHAASVIDTLYTLNQDIDIVLLDGDKNKHGTHVLNVEIIGNEDAIPALKAKGYSHFLITVGVIKPTPLRALLFQKMIDAGLQPYTCISASAIISPHTEIGAGSVILNGAIIGPKTMIGQNAIINTAAIIEHDAHVGDHGMVAPRVTLLGGAFVGHNVMIGAHSVIAQNITIGDHNFIKANSVINEDVSAIDC